MSHRILIIEDNEKNIYLLTFLLEHSGFQVLQARSGEVGLQLAEEERPHLVLLDIQLPQMDGYEIARRIRATPAIAEVPIVAVTSFAMVGDRERVLEAGCTDYIEKPIDSDTFVDRISRHLPKDPDQE